MINRVCLTGRITKDLDLRVTQAGRSSHNIFRRRKRLFYSYATQTAGSKQDIDKAEPASARPH